MAEYIDTTNQEILWKTFHKIPRVSVLAYSQKEFLFKNAISMVYQNITPNVHVDKVKLHELNRETMKILLEQVLQKNVSQMVDSQMFQTPEEMTQRNFESKQKQYDKMTEKKVVPKPSDLFQESNCFEEGAITNMDERIEEFQKHRERDMKKINDPLHSVPSDDIVTIDPLQSIMEAIRKIEFRLEVIENRM